MRRRFSVDLTEGMSTSTRSGADIILAMVGGVNKFQYRYRYARASGCLSDGCQTMYLSIIGVETHVLLCNQADSELRGNT